MTICKLISVAALALSAAAVSVVIQHESQTKLRAGDVLLREQSNQLAALTVAHERLSNLLAKPNSAPADDHAAELARLRNEVEALQKQANELDQAPPKSLESRLARRPPGAPSLPTDFDDATTQERHRQMLGARDLGTAFLMYATDHQNQAPSTFDQMAPYLAERNLSLPQPNQFEIVYQGSLDRLEGVPFGSVAVVRGQKSWTDPNGKVSRAYGFLDGHGQMVGTDDHFQSYDAMHVISPPQSDPSQP
jgi:hypothetical protein